MSRRFLILTMLLCLLWQALLGQASAQIVDASTTLSHALVHDVGVSHHHHDDDAALQLADQDDLDAHVHHDGGHFHALPWSSGHLGLSFATGSAPAAGHDRRLTSPCLEGPLRPPRWIA